MSHFSAPPIPPHFPIFFYVGISSYMFHAVFETIPTLFTTATPQELLEAGFGTPPALDCCLKLVAPLGAFSHSANHHSVHPRHTPANHPYRGVHDPLKTASGVRNSGPWDPWLPVVENSRLFAQRTVRPLLASRHLRMSLSLRRQRCPSASQPPVPSLSLPGLASPPALSLPFPWEVVPTEPPDCPCFTAPCQARTEQGTGPRLYGTGALGGPALLWPQFPTPDTAHALPPVWSCEMDCGGSTEKVDGQWEGRTNVRVRRLAKNLFGGVGGVGRRAPFPTPPPPPEGGSKGRVSCFRVFHASSMTKPLALSQSLPVTVTVTVSLQNGGGAPPTVVSHSNTSLPPPPPPPHPISKLESRFSDICIEEMSLWPLQPLSATPPS